MPAVWMMLLCLQDIQKVFTSATNRSTVELENNDLDLNVDR